MVSYISKDHLSLFLSAICLSFGICAILIFSKIYIFQKANQL
jgi:hypothetical protein